MTTAWTTPASWTGTPSESFFNSQIRDNLLHLYEKVPPGINPADRAGIGGAGTSEEWGTTTTGLSWSSSPTTVDSNTTIADHLYILNQADTTVRLGTKSWSPGSGAFDARMGGIMLGVTNSVASANYVIGFHIGDSGNNNRLAIQYTFNPATPTLNINCYTYTASTYTLRGASTPLPVGSTVYTRIARDASNNVSFYWSLNGSLWAWVATQSFTLTVANIGVYAQGAVGSTCAFAIDWLRTSA